MFSIDSIMSTDLITLRPESTVAGARRFRQAGWDVEVAALGAFEAGPLPRKLVLRNGSTRIRLVISHWQVPAPVD